MPKIIIRIIAVLLIPSLMSEPTLAFAHQFPDFYSISFARINVEAGLFGCEAFALVATNSIRPIASVAKVGLSQELVRISQETMGRDIDVQEVGSLARRPRNKLVRLIVEKRVDRGRRKLLQNAVFHTLLPTLPLRAAPIVEQGIRRLTTAELMNVVPPIELAPNS